MVVGDQDGVQHLVCDRCGGEMLHTGEGMIHLMHRCIQCKKMCVAEKEYPHIVTGHETIKLGNTIVTIPIRETV